MLIETLEDRRLLSASLNTTTGLLTITGTDNPDRILVFKNPVTNKIIVNQATLVPAMSTSAAHVVRSHLEFNASQVKSILANGNAGNDSIDVGGLYYTPTPTATSALPVVYHRLSIPATVNGGNGNDELYGGDGKDQLNGGAGYDHLYGRGGDDVLNGNDGNDYLNGGRGADQLNGNAGNDYIFAVDGAATDKIDGGTNDAPTATRPGDVAVIDKGDTVTNVERVLAAPTPTPHA